MLMWPKQTFKHRLRKAFKIKWCSKCLTKIDKFCIAAIYVGNRKCLTPLGKPEGRKDCKKIGSKSDNLYSLCNTSIGDKRETLFKSPIIVDSLADCNSLVRKKQKKQKDDEISFRGGSDVSDEQLGSPAPSHAQVSCPESRIWLSQLC